MKNKINSKIIPIVITIIILLIGLIIFILNFTTTDSSYSIIEKKWITDNKTKVVDVNVYNDIPVYGYNGQGVIFDFLDSFSLENNINFNKISYYVDDEPDYGQISFRVLNNNESVSEKDILMYTDNYVILSLENKNLTNLDEITKIGINKEIKDDINYYLNSDVEYALYDDDNKLIEGILNKEVDYIAVANMMQMDNILQNNLNIVYNMTDLAKKYVLRVEDNTLRSILTKYYNNYLLDDFKDSYSQNYLNIYFDSKNVNDLARKSYNSKVYKYGYAINMPYENYDNGSFVGIISNYLFDFENIFNIEVQTVRYDNVDSVKSALVSNEIDFALTNFNYNSLNMESAITDVISNHEYVILSKNNIDAKSLKSFKDETINVVGSSYLYTLCNQEGIKTNVYEDTNDLLRNIDNNSIVIMDYDTYFYYKDSKLSEYIIVYKDFLNDGYRFIVNKEDLVLEELIDYYVSSTSYNNIRYKYNTNILLDKDNTNTKIFIITLIVLLILISSLIFTIKSKKNSTMSKEDKLKYIDPMTSLKNRNYLNYNINKWDDNVIFPQCIIMLDLNKLKKINDKEGRAIGDEVIKKTASILINNQKENSDILRSSGDEFLIYMIGYEETFIKSYIKQLAKEIKNIPKSNGAEFGYSMIYDEVKIIDDAINEALIMLEKNKEKNGE